MTIERDLATALEASDHAAALALEYFERGVSASTKHDGSPLSEADLAVERALRRSIAAVSPTDGFLGEELGRQGSSERVWILDPIDGTSCFVVKDPHWRLHVALEAAGRIDVAVVTSPALRRQWWATKGGGAYESAWPRTGEPTRLSVSTTSRMELATLDGLDDACRARLPVEGIVAAVSGQGWCGGLIALLRGEVDCFLADRFQTWDHAPWTLLVTEAGGRFTNRDGNADPQGGGLYSNAPLHDELLRAIGFDASL